MKCRKCGSEMVHSGAFDAVNGVRYKEYVCPNRMCGDVRRGEKMEE